ncbi:hypothetical protein BDDG_12873 [Blastomyces dermatitidis ATCC 18188]|uniref:Uncharacterized protein n=1 Tax=Ajellomyces dermatitidis (strain ATCC 18188 / CBS 674.68) TaxID=653446 RepID=A0A0J9ETM9_AJEDA|nr:hypothetical protein BDDG_12873 [Blastomyces dermatitidis ATCC 18188]
MRSLIEVHFGGSSSRGWRKAQPDFNKLESADRHCTMQDSDNQQGQKQPPGQQFVE